jgi:hypothetical protein
MSASWKGTLQVVLISEEPGYIADSGVEWVDRTWAGRKDAILGWAADLKESGIGYNITAQPPVYLCSARVPVNEPTEVLALDRYEITTEAQDKSIFELPGVIEEMLAYDASIAESAETYKARAERYVDKGLSYDLPGFPLFGKVVRHLRNGVTGYQIDFLTLRRYRQIDQSYAYAGGKMTLSDGLVIYSSSQLNLPANVAFTLPITPADIGADYTWGWRMRGQRVEIVGNYAEQVVELVFAPWSLLAYEPATVNLNW